ncbi:MAG: hypothetical protein KBC15_04345, partial [Candidatus Levybacteria bacterium]|nr:hypothetical protein [Candidatus Levybacteria bacterium]
MVDTLVLGTSAVKSLEVQVLSPAHHIMTEFSSPKESPSPKEQVERVVTALWEHPLLDDATVAHRKAALTALPPFLEKFGLDDSEYVGILKGSAQRITDETSDYDFTIIRPDLYSRPGDKFTEAQTATRQEQSKIDIFHIYGIPHDYPMLATNFNNVITQLLFTPDEYLVGNIDLAHQYRRNLIDQLDNDPKSKRLFWGEDNFPGSLPLQFADCFKNWGIIPQTSRLAMKLHPNHKELTQNRFEKEHGRLEANIAKRAVMSKNPDWRYDFMQSIENLQPPPFETYKSYLEQTNGAVHIDQRFTAQNLATSI